MVPAPGLATGPDRGATPGYWGEEPGSLSVTAGTTSATNTQSRSVNCQASSGDITLLLLSRTHCRDTPGGQTSGVSSTLTCDWNGMY